MKSRSVREIVFLLAATSFALIEATSLRAELIDKTARVSGITVDNKVVLTSSYDRNKPYPAILAFWGGPQNMNTVDSG